MADKTCGKCKYWCEVDSYDVGRCDAIRHDEYSGTRYTEDGDEVESNNKPAFVVDRSGYYAALKTRENFGCVLFSERQDNDV